MTNTIHNPHGARLNTTSGVTGPSGPSLSPSLQALGALYDQRHTRFAAVAASHPKIGKEYTTKPVNESSSFAGLLSSYPGLKKLLDRNSHAIFSGQPDAGKQLYPVAWEGWGHSSVADKDRREEIVFVVAKSGDPSLKQIEIPMKDGTVHKLPAGFQIVYVGREGDHQRTFEKGGGSQYFQNFDVQARPGQKVQMAYLRWHPDATNGAIDGWKAGLPDFELGGGEPGWPRDLTGAYPDGRNEVLTARASGGGATTSPAVIRCPD